MESRREFIKQASLLAGMTALSSVLPASIQRALAINAPVGSTYLDAEHIVFLMQENRSFDHCFGTLKGVRGFNDPRALRQPNGLPVWIQTDKDQNTFSPFRLDIENTKMTWMGSLPHGWRDMVAARNNGKMNTWLDAKRPGNRDYKQMPLTLGYYERKDLPFYYAFADAFTICDQHFCSSLTGTSANRSYFWSGTVREEPHDPESTAHVENGQINYKNVGWKTYPERLEEAGITWRVYQNELSVPIGFDDDHEDWLANFTNNNLEFHKQYGVAFHPHRRSYRTRRLAELETLIKDANLDEATRKKLATENENLRLEDALYTKERYESLSEHEKNIHKKAFTTNTGDPHYHELEEVTYTDASGEHRVKVPKGDVLHQFRKDVDEGKLPTVSWLVAPGNFSDHPTFPWYGAWYVSEVLNILTKNPEVWKKTIFILNYDENDGYFDHVPPFVPPLTGRPETGAAASGIDTGDEYVTNAQEKIRSKNPEATLESPIGLGFRVPMVIASPWTKGGWVSSEVFDLTSPLQFLEHFLEKKTGKRVIETNLSSWRRLICGNLTSAFREIQEHEPPALTAVNRNEEVVRIHASRNKALPGNFVSWSAAQLDAFRNGALDAKQLLPQQEPGVKPACPLPYDLRVNGFVNLEQQFVIRFEVERRLDVDKTLGAPVYVVSRVPYGTDEEPGRTWNFAVREDEKLHYYWPISDFKDGLYHLEVYGPNGFYREFKGSAQQTAAIFVSKEPKYDHVLKLVMEHGKSPKEQFTKTDLRKVQQKFDVKFNSGNELLFDYGITNGWYDFEIRSNLDPNYYQRYAGHLESGKPSITDPMMGGLENL